MRKVLLATACAVLLTSPLTVAAQADDVIIKENGDRTVVKERAAPPNKVIVKEREPARTEDKVIIKEK